MEAREIRDKLNKMIVTRKQLAESINIEYVYFTRFLNGASLGKEKLEQIQNWLDEKRPDSKI